MSPRISAQGVLLTNASTGVLHVVKVHIATPT
jgi:hypothetical protein